MLFPETQEVPEVFWTGETSVCFQARAFTRGISTHDVTHLFLFPETHLLSLMSLIKWFSSQHLWFPVGLKMFALSSLLEVFSELHEECSPAPGANSVRAGMFSKKTGYQSPFYFSGRLILHLLFWSNPFELTDLILYVTH